MGTFDNGSACLPLRRPDLDSAAAPPRENSRVGETPPALSCPRRRVLPLNTSHLQAALAIDHLSFEAPWCALDFQSVFDDAFSLGLGLELDGRLVGYAIGTLEVPSVHLINLAVDPSHRRMGHADSLVRAIMARAIEAGCDGCTLEVRASNAGAQRLYCVLGFEVVDIWRRFYTAPQEDALIMYRSLCRHG